MEINHCSSLKKSGTWQIVKITTQLILCVHFETVQFVERVIFGQTIDNGNEF